MSVTVFKLYALCHCLFQMQEVALPKADSAHIPSFSRRLLFIIGPHKQRQRIMERLISLIQRSEVISTW